MNVFYKTEKGLLTKKTISTNLKQYFKTDKGKEQIDRQSIFMANYVIEHGNRFDKKFKKGTHTSTKAGTIKYDSSYELQAYKILDNMPKVLYYDRCKFYIKYELESKTRRYIPDIFVTYSNHTKEIIEVKPEYQLEFPECLAKFAAGREYSKQNKYKYSVWSENKLFN